MENLTADERRLVLSMMKNYIEKYTPAGDFEKSVEIYRTFWAKLKAQLVEWSLFLSLSLSRF